MPQAEVEETLKRIEAHKGVIGTIIVSAEGKPTNMFILFIQHNFFSNITSLQYSLTLNVYLF